MLSVLASGTLARDPQQRTSATGKPYCTALLRVPCDDAEALLASIIAFNQEAVQAIMALSRGDSVAVTGKGKLSNWEKDGEQKYGLSVVAEKVLTPYQLDKRRRQTATATESADA